MLSRLILAASLLISAGCASHDHTSAAKPAPTQEPAKPESPTAESAKPEGPKQESPQPETKPDLAADGYPQGKSTPEGVAADLARSFCTADTELFKTTCIAPFGGGEGKDEYIIFLAETCEQMNEVKNQKMQEGKGNPKEIARVYKARTLSANGPNSAAFAFYDIQELRFVDVVATLYGGGEFTARTLVVKGSSGDWYALPRPDLYPMISGGLNDEPDSTELWKAP